MFKSKTKKTKFNIRLFIPAGVATYLFLTLFQVKVYRNISSKIAKYDKSQYLKPRVVEHNPKASTTSNSTIVYSKEKRLLFNKPDVDVFYKQSTQDKSNDKNKVGWENLVFIVLTHNDPNANSLIQAQFETWMKRAGIGFDIVIVTDIDDPRSDQEILPKDCERANIDIYRSDTPKEGRKGRSKVLDGFFYVQRKYQNNPKKLYFMKVDPDNYILPYTLLKFLQNLHERTYPQPVDFGKSNCNNDFVCYTQGGLYGWDREGFARTFNYMTNHKDTIYDEIYYNRYNPGRNILQNEDVFTSYAFRKATGYPSIFNRGIGANLTEIIHYKQMPKDLVSIHPIKTIDDFYRLEKIFYVGDTDALKSRGGSLQALLKSSHLLDMSKLFWDAQKMEFRQK